MIRIVHRYTRGQILADPNTLYVFGDNLARVGLGGQAGEARGCKNTVGIPTLVSPAEPASKKSLFRLKWAVRFAFLKLHLHLINGGDIVWPADGVGTGIANLSHNSPELHHFIKLKFTRLLEKYDVDIQHTERQPF